MTKTKTTSLTHLCIYYKGEKECPFREADKQMFWLGENGGLSKPNLQAMPGVNVLPPS